LEKRLGFSINYLSLISVINPMSKLRDIPYTSTCYYIPIVDPNSHEVDHYALFRFEGDKVTYRGTFEGKPQVDGVRDIPFDDDLKTAIIRAGYRIYGHSIQLKT